MITTIIDTSEKISNDFILNLCSIMNDKTSSKKYKQIFTHRYISAYISVNAEITLHKTQRGGIIDCNIPLYLKFHVDDGELPIPVPMYPSSLWLYPVVKTKELKTSMSVEVCTREDYDENICTITFKNWSNILGCEHFTPYKIVENGNTLAIFIMVISSININNHINTLSHQIIHLDTSTEISKDMLLLISNISINLGCKSIHRWIYNNDDRITEFGNLIDDY